MFSEKLLLGLVGQPDPIALEVAWSLDPKALGLALWVFAQWRTLWRLWRAFSFSVFSEKVRLGLSEQLDPMLLGLAWSPDFFFWIRGNPTPQKSALCEPRWASKTPAVSGSYKRCTPWLELETCCADLKPFAITPRPLGTLIAKP